MCATPRRLPLSLLKKFQPIRSSRLSSFREHIHECLVLLYRQRILFLKRLHSAWKRHLSSYMHELYFANINVHLSYIPVSLMCQYKMSIYLSIYLSTVYIYVCINYVFVLFFSRCLSIYLSKALSIYLFKHLVKYF